MYVALAKTASRFHLKLRLNGAAIKGPINLAFNCAVFLFLFLVLVVS
jgi:hypothetical protein